MNRVVGILMKRDHNTKEEAESRLAECRRLCDECLVSGDYESMEDMIYSEFGLEMDYIFDILD